jgi:hypothetical protein
MENPPWQGSYSINDNTDVQLLSQYTRVTGDLFIFEPDPGTTIEGLNNLTTVGGLYIKGNDLYNLSGLNNLTTVNGDLMINQFYHGFLTALGLNSLCSVKGAFTIIGQFLCTYLVEDLRDQVIGCLGIGGAVDIHGNKTCVEP